jgi:hypothetical protein
LWLCKYRSFNTRLVGELIIGKTGVRLVFISILKGLAPEVGRRFAYETSFAHLSNQTWVRMILKDLHTDAQQLRVNCTYILLVATFPLLNREYDNASAETFGN